MLALYLSRVLPLALIAAFQELRDLHRWHPAMPGGLSVLELADEFCIRIVCRPGTWVAEWTAVGVRVASGETWTELTVNAVSLDSRSARRLVLRAIVSLIAARHASVDVGFVAPMPEVARCVDRIERSFGLPSRPRRYERKRWAQVSAKHSAYLADVAADVATRELVPVPVREAA